METRDVTQLAPTQREAVAALTEQGATVFVDDNGIVVDIAVSRITDVGLQHVAELTSLQTLVLSGTDITDAGLVHLKGLTKLKGLGLIGTKVSAKGVNDLKQVLPKCLIMG